MAGSSFCSGQRAKRPADLPVTVGRVSDDLLAEAKNPDGRLIQIHASTWDHVLDGHPEMADHLNTVMETIAKPEHREPDIRAGRERYFRRGGPERWIRVVAEFADGHDRLVTTFPQSNGPTGWRG